MWAPAIVEKDGKYFLFFGANDVHEGEVGGIGVAVAGQPQGPFEVPVATGAGHHSVMKHPVNDQWYMVYHRRPLGETDANHRVTCIDEMQFDDKGHIKPVKITFVGVKRETLK